MTPYCLKLVLRKELNLVPERWELITEQHKSNSKNQQSRLLGHSHVQKPTANIKRYQSLSKTANLFFRNIMHYTICSFHAN